MKSISDRFVRGGGNPLSYLSSAILAAAAFVALSFSLPAVAEGTGPFGYPNLLVNPDFEDATIPSTSNSGYWGRFLDPTPVKITGWTGAGKAGVASKNDTVTWTPADSGTDNYRAFIQMTSGITSDDYSWIEQAVTLEKSGVYAFTCRYATRSRNNFKYGGTLGFSVAVDGTTNEQSAVTFLDNDHVYRSHTWYLTLEAGKTYVFRLHGVATGFNSTKDRTAIIGSCALECLDKGPFGQPNLFANPDFESATVAANSNSGQWGWYKDGKVSLAGWTGYGYAGVAKFGNTTWDPALPDADDYFAFIQMAKGFADGASYIEQTVTPEATGLYAFTCKYATRWTYNPNASRLGFSVVSGNVTNELEEAVLLAGDSRYRNVMRYVTLEAGRSYTFRLYGIAESGDADVDRTAIIGSCSLELLPAADRTISADYHLTADEDWSAQTVEIAAGAKVHLDGHTLKIGYVRPGGNGAAPEFTDETVSPGVLCVTVQEGETIPNPGWRVSGGATLVKDGSGTFAWRGGTVGEDAPILVTNGLFRLDTWPMNVFGTNGTFTIRDKGQYDIHFGFAHLQSPSYARTFYIEGDGPDGSGAIVNNATSGSVACHFSTAVMTGDATIGGTSRIDFRSRGGDVVGLYGTNLTLTVKNKKLAFCEGESHLDCARVVVDADGELEPCNNGGILDVPQGILLVNGGTLSSWASGNPNTQELRFPVTAGEGGGMIRRAANWYRITGPVTVTAGNTLDCYDGGPWYSGAITNETGSTFKIGGDLFAIGGIFRNDGTVVHTAGKFYFGSRDDHTHPCSVENNSVVRSTGGNFYFRYENSAHGAGLFDLAGSTATMEGDLSDFTGVVRVSGGTASLASVTNFPGTLKLAGGKVSSSLAEVATDVVFDLSEQTGSLNIETLGYTTLPDGKAVTIDLRGRDVAVGDRLLTWTKVPSFVFSLDPETAQNGVPLVSTPIGLYYGANTTDAIYATWTGAAGSGDWNDADNWTCIDSVGGTIVGGVPNSETHLTLGADVPLGGWEAFSAAAQTGPIDLNGHRIVIHGANGNSPALSITNTSTSARAEIRFTLGAGTNFVKTANLVLAGNISLVVDGEGKFTWNGGTLAADIPITVSGGVFKLGVTTANVFGSSGTITVNGTGQFDLNTGSGASPVRKRTFYIEGDGPDGSGAIYNSATTGNSGNHLEHVVMTGDATIGGTSRIDFRDCSGGLDGAGYALTIKGVKVAFVQGGTYASPLTTHLTCGSLLLDGGIVEPCSRKVTSGKNTKDLFCTLTIADGITIKNGGKFQSWDNDGSTPNYNGIDSITVAEGGGSIESTKYWYTISVPITVTAGNTLTCPTMAPWYYGAITNETGATLNISLTSGTSSPYQFVTCGGLFVNDGTVNHTAGEFWLGHRNGSSNPCRVENDGTICSSGGKFSFNSSSHAHGAGTFEIAGSSTATLAGDFSDFTGTILLAGGTASISSIGTFTGTLRLKGGTISTSLAAFTGTAVIDVADQTESLDAQSKGWLTFASGKEVLVDTGSRELQYGDRLISWTTAPSGVRFKLLGEHEGVLDKDGQGVVYAKRHGMMFIVR